MHHLELLLIHQVHSVVLTVCSYSSDDYISLGNVYIVETAVYGLDNGKIRKVTVSTGIISTIAGSGSTSYSGDNGAATAAGMYPDGVAVDSSGTYYNL